jgi:aerobic carbon-monoxide dehydrogenase medium subunit
MYPTTYRRPKTLAEAKEMFAEAENASFLSGGHTLLPALKLRLASPSDLIDLGAIPELRGIKLEGRTLVIGATSLHVEVAESPLVRQHIPALAGLAGSIGDRHVRHRGTMGGSVSNNDPAADYPSGVLGLGATVVTDKRRILADDFFTGLYETAREPGEILTRIEFPIPDNAGYAKFMSPASRFSIAGVFISRTGKTVRVAVTGAGSGGVFRATALEAALAAGFRAESLAKITIDPSIMMGDQNGTPEYRANLVMVMARRAVQNMGTITVCK